MYSTQAYLYQQKNRIIITEVDADFDTKRSRIVYAKPFRVSRGVDNNLLFEFQNQEQRPFDLSGSTLIFRMISRDGTELLLEKAVTVLNAKFGRARVTINVHDLDNVEPQDANWSVVRQSGILSEPVYMDEQGGSRGEIEIRDAVFPDYVPTAEITMPTQAEFKGGLRAYGTFNDANAEVAKQYSSWTRGRDVEQSTFQVTVKDYTGKLEIQGAMNNDDIWFGKKEYPWFIVDFSLADDNDNIKVSELDLEDSSETFIVNITGYYPWLRIYGEVSDGTIERILYR